MRMSVGRPKFWRQHLSCKRLNSFNVTLIFTQRSQKRRTLTHGQANDHANDDCEDAADGSVPQK